MRLGREETVAPGDVVEPSAEPLQRPVCCMGEHLQIAGLGHVPVIVGPRLGHAPRAWGQAGFVGRDRLPCPGAKALQRPQQRHQIVVPCPLQLADRAALGLGVGLAGDALQKGIRKFGDIGQLGPGPFQRGAELGEEMAHARVAAGDPVGLKKPHLRPSQAEAVADGVVDLARRRDTVMDEPKRLAPDGLQQPVRDVGRDRAAECQGVHAEALEDLGGGLGAPADQLDQRKQIDRVEGVGDEDTALRIELFGHEARGRRGNDPGRMGQDLG